MLSELAKKIQIQLIRVSTLFMTISVCMNAITIDKAFPQTPVPLLLSQALHTIVPYQ